MSKFSVSVVIPLYNKAPFIRRTLETVLNQTLAPNEIIIVDDGSTDGSPELIADLIFGSTRLIRQSNAGPGPARNRGTAEATSEWIALIDGDDRWSSNHLETLAEVAAAHPEVAVVASRHERLVATAPLPAAEATPHSTAKFDYLESTSGLETLFTSATAVTRQAMLKTGGFGDFLPGEDVDLWFRLALDYSTARSSRRTSFYGQQTGGIMESRTLPDNSTPRGSRPDIAIRRALADPRYAHRHKAIRAFRQRRMVNAVKQELYHGNAKVARRIIRACASVNAKVPQSYRLLALLPSAILKLSIRTAARVRNVRLSRSR